MMFFGNSFVPSAGEAWQAVPLISLHLPALGAFFWCNTWAVTAAIAVVASCLSHSQNHPASLAGNSALSGLRKAVSNFWNNQILERVHMKWRTVDARSVAPMAGPSNRLASAWVWLSPVQRKTTGVWVSVLFFVLLASNAFGLVPLCSAVTGQAGTTLGLSLALWAAVTLAGIQRLGTRFVKLFLPSGPSWPMAPLFVLLESISYSFRAVSLGVRLWANMLAGHQLIHLVTALALVPALCLNVVLGAPITALAAGLLMALSGLETIVCVLQSGVFCLLASFYLHEGLSRRDALAAAQSDCSDTSLSIPPPLEAKEATMWPLVFCVTGMGTALLISLSAHSLLVPILGLPLVGAVLIGLLPSGAVSAHRRVALVVTLLTLALCLRLWASFEPWAAVPFQQVVGLTAGWGGLVWIRLEFGVDGLSLWMVLLTAALMPTAVLCSWQTQHRHSGAFMALLLVLETALLAAFTCLDLLGFYVLYESALLPMFLLIGLGGSRPRKVRAAYLLVLYTLVGSLAMLPCVLLMYSQAGTTSFELLVHQAWAPARQLVLWWGLFLAFAVKVPMMPVHLWLPEAHVEASTAGSVLLAGVLLKLGTYGLLRFSLPLLPEACVYYAPFVLVLCMMGVVYASLTTLRQVDLKKVIAYSSVAHMNLVVAALFTLSDLGGLSAAFLMLAHGVTSPALFLCVGALYDRAHTKALKYLGGAATAMPLFSALFFIFSLANMALPLTPNFVGEFLCLCGLFGHNIWALVAALGGVLLSAAYTMWAYARVVHGLPKPGAFKAMADLNRREVWTFVPLVALTLWWGLKPGLVLDQLSAGLSFWHQASLGSVAPTAWVSALVSSAVRLAEGAVARLHLLPCFVVGRWFPQGGRRTNARARKDGRAV